MALLEPGHIRVELTLIFWVDEGAPFSISLMQAQALVFVLVLSWSKEANPGHSSLPLPPIIMFFVNTTFACTFCAGTFPHCFLCT